MNDIWTELNKQVPVYLNEVIMKYSLKVVSLGFVRTALVNTQYAIIISLERFSVDMDFIHKDHNGKLVCFGIGNFLPERFDENDRKNLIKGTDISSIIFNNLIVINNGLLNKCGDVLSGSLEWINDFAKSKWYNEKKVTLNDAKILSKFI